MSTISMEEIRIRKTMEWEVGIGWLTLNLILTSLNEELVINKILTSIIQIQGSKWLSKKKVGIHKDLVTMKSTKKKLKVK